jgi:hypothetical protein
MSSNANKILLNIGGKLFDTTRATLENSKYFRELLDPKSSPHFESNGRIFIDRDGKHFRHILNYLRDGSVPALNPPDQAQLIIEAGVYQLPELVSALKAKLTGTGLGGRSRKATKRRRRRYK